MHATSRVSFRGRCVSTKARHLIAPFLCSRPVPAVMVAVVAGCLFAPRAWAQPAPTKTKVEKLIAADAFPKKWKHVSSDTASKLADTWTLDAKTDPKNPVLICTGKPSGYVRTTDKYTNFELTLDWKYPADPNCNSGILLHSGEDKVWPASIQVQLHRPVAGSIFPMKGATTANRVTRKSVKLDTGAWHSCRIVSKDGTISVWINGKKVGEVTECKPGGGYIALQSEGSEIHFRKFEIRKLEDTKKTAGKPSETEKRRTSTPKDKPCSSTSVPVIGCPTGTFLGSRNCQTRFMVHSSCLRFAPQDCRVGETAASFHVETVCVPCRPIVFRRCHQPRRQSVRTFRSANLRVLPECRPDRRMDSDR